MKLILLFLLCSAPLCAFKNIETTKKEIVTALQKNTPAVLPRFTQFCVQYDQSVTAFFDKQNNESLEIHITRMERDLTTLDVVIRDKQFIVVKDMLIELRVLLQELIVTLKPYILSKNSVGLAFKMRRFKKLLPVPINRLTEFSLFWALNHRVQQ